MRASIEAVTQLDAPRVVVEVRHLDNTRLFVPAPVNIAAPETLIEPGQRFEIEAMIENRLAPGRYLVVCYVLVGQRGTEQTASSPGVISIETVANGTWLGGSGLVSLDYELSVWPQLSP